MIKFSLVLATLNRDTELYVFFDSLLLQDYDDFEVIVVDQNIDDRVKKVIGNYEGKFNILYLKIEPLGLSYARNFGLKYVSGEVVAFPDDDCWYSEGLLKKVAYDIDTKDIDGVSGVCQDQNGNGSVTKFSKSPCMVEKRNIFRTITSISFFIKFNQNVLFDENLGVGAKTIFGAGEDIDYILTYISKGKKILFDPNIVLGHPQIVVRYGDDRVIKKTYSYGVGLGYLLQKHNYPVSYLVNLLVRNLIWMVIALFCFDLGKFRFYFSTFKGRIEGWLYRD